MTDYRSIKTQQFDMFQPFNLFKDIAIIYMSNPTVPSIEIPSIIQGDIIKMLQQITPFFLAYFSLYPQLLNV